MARGISGEQAIAQAREDIERSKTTEPSPSDSQRYTPPRNMTDRQRAAWEGAIEAREAGREERQYRLRAEGTPGMVGTMRRSSYPKYNVDAYVLDMADDVAERVMQGEHGDVAAALVESRPDFVIGDTLRKNQALRTTWRARLADDIKARARMAPSTTPFQTRLDAQREMADEMADDIKAMVDAGDYAGILDMVLSRSSWILGGDGASLLANLPEDVEDLTPEQAAALDKMTGKVEAGTEASTNWNLRGRRPGPSAVQGYEGGETPAEALKLIEEEAERKGEEQDERWAKRDQLQRAKRNFHDRWGVYASQGDHLLKLADRGSISLDPELEKDLRGTAAIERKHKAMEEAMMAPFRKETGLHFGRSGFALKEEARALKEEFPPKGRVGERESAYDPMGALDSGYRRLVAEGTE